MASRSPCRSSQRDSSARAGSPVCRARAGPRRPRRLPPGRSPARRAGHRVRPQLGRQPGDLAFQPVDLLLHRPPRMASRWRSARLQRRSSPRLAAIRCRPGFGLASHLAAGEYQCGVFVEVAVERRDPTVVAPATADRCERAAGGGRARRAPARRRTNDSAMAAPRASPWSRCCRFVEQQAVRRFQASRASAQRAFSPPDIGPTGLEPSRREAETGEKLRSSCIAALRVRLPGRSGARCCSGDSSGRNWSSWCWRSSDRQPVAPAQLARGRRQLGRPMLLTSVDLPAPFTPRMPMRSPERIRNFTSSSTVRGRRPGAGPRVEQSLRQAARLGELEAPLAPGARRLDRHQSLEHLDPALRLPGLVALARKRSTKLCRCAAVREYALAAASCCRCCSAQASSKAL